MMFVAIISLLLTLLAVFVGARAADVRAGRRQCSSIDVLGVLPFCAIGLFVGSLVSGQAAPAIVNLIYPAHGVPVGAVGAAAVPAARSCSDIAPLWPAYHLAQMALDTVGAPSMGTLASHIAALLRRDVAVLPARGAPARRTAASGCSAPPTRAASASRCAARSTVARHVRSVVRPDHRRRHGRQAKCRRLHRDHVGRRRAKPVRCNGSAGVRRRGRARHPVIADFDGGSRNAGLRHRLDRRRRRDARRQFAAPRSG